MGSWDATCMATRSSILPGDPVVGFFLHKKPGRESLSYNLAGLPIYGYYDDYGGIYPDSMSEPLEEFQLGLCRTWQARDRFANKVAQPESLKDYIRYAADFHFDSDPPSLSGPFYDLAIPATDTKQGEVMHTVPITLGMCHRSAFDLLTEYGGPMRNASLAYEFCILSRSVAREYNHLRDLVPEEERVEGALWRGFEREHPEVHAAIETAFSFRNGMNLMRRLLVPDTTPMQATDEALGLEFDLARDVLERTAKRLEIYE